MNRENTFLNQDGQPPEQRFERLVQTLARQMDYPPTPDLVPRVDWKRYSRRVPTWLPQRRVAWAGLILILILTLALAVPPVRAQIVQWIRVGAVIIFPRGAEPTPTPTPVPTTGTPSSVTPTPRPTPTNLPSLLNLSGETTLLEAYQRDILPIRIPEYPADLGEPDIVYIQEFWDTSGVILIWLEPEDPERVRLALFELTSNHLVFEKVRPRILEETRVGDTHAFWTEGPYILRFRNGNIDYQRIVEGRALIWTEKGLTYRLETDLDLNEAVKIAESLYYYEPGQPLPGTPTP